MKWKKILCFSLCAAVLAGCGAPSSGTSGSAESDGLQVVVQFDADLNTMDHSIATDSNSFIMQRMCLAGLTALGTDGEYHPELAESWTISDDGLLYTFFINEEATWSDGTPVTADDFVFAWQRLANPDTASEYAFILETMHVRNASQVIDGELPVEELGIREVDDKTLEVELEMPCSFMLTLLDFPSLYALNRNFYETHAETYAQSPEDMLFSGRYAMTDWQQGNEYTFTRREDYFDLDEDAADTVVFKFIQDTQSAMLAWQQGDIDVVRLQSEQVDQYKGEPGFTNKMTNSMWYLQINFAKTPFENKNLRAAIAYAIDRETIVNDVLKNGSTAAEGFIPKNFATSPEGVDFREEAGVISVYDPDLASDYYAKAVEEIGNDVTFELLFEDSEASKAVAENLQSQLQNSCPGLTVTLNSKPKKTRIEMMDDQEFEVVLTRWGPDYMDAQTFMDLFVSDSQIGNYGQYSSSSYDALVKSAGSGEDAADAQKRWENYIEAEKILVTEDYAIVPVYQDGGVLMINPEIEGINLARGGEDYRHVKAV